MLKHKTITSKVFKLIDELRFDEALSLVEVERLYAKKDPFYYSTYAIIHLYMNKFADAKIFVEKALSLNPYDEMSLNTVAYINLLEGNIQEAIHTYINILDMNPRNRLVKRNLNRFKANKNIDKILTDLEPNAYLRESYIFAYQKALIIFFILAFITIPSIYYLYKLPFKSISAEDHKEEYLKERLRYKSIVYLSQEEENRFEGVLSADSGLSDDNPYIKLTILNNLLSSNIELSRKIELEHRNRSIIYQRLDESLYLSYPQNKDIFSKLYLYDSVNILLNSKIKREGEIKYIIKGFNGDTLRLFDYDRKIPSSLTDRPIKLLVRINASKEKSPFATVISILN